MINFSNNQEIVIGRAAFMIKTHILPLLFAVLTTAAANAASEMQQACEHFFLVLETVPHDMLTRSSGVHQSLWDGKQDPGCEIKFVTNDRLLSGRKVRDFDAIEGTEMYR